MEMILWHCSKIAFFILIISIILTNPARATEYRAIDLTPNGFTGATVNGAGGGRQVGYINTVNGNHAVIWNGSANGYTDLNPAGYNVKSEAYGISGKQQVGVAWGTTASQYAHAFLWNGSASGGIDLNPSSGYYSSLAYGTNGTQQVGIASSSTSYQPHAMLWSGTAASSVDLNPSGFTYSYGYSIGGTQQAGYGVKDGSFYALLWNGSSDSYTTLNPDGFDFAIAYGTNGTQQVGYGGV